MLKPGFRPSLTSLVAFFLIVGPVVYVLSYAPVVRVCGRTVESRINLETMPQSGAFLPYPDFGEDAVLVGSEVVIRQRVAHSSLYPIYGPVDWLIGHTPLHAPLLSWADLWGVREAFELSEIERFLFDQSRLRRTDPG